MALCDGTTDATAAFIKAVSTTPAGALLIPEGRYVLTDVVKITRSNLVLRGAGPDKSVLVIPKSLAQIAGPKTTDGMKSSYAFSGGFLSVRRVGLTGHHALWATGGSQDCLFSDFRFDTTYVHDLTVEGRANGNVFRNGSGVSLNFDHHRNAPYENLFTNLQVGDPKRIWASGGREDRGLHSGARATFWNLRADKTKFPKWPAWPQINVIGAPGYSKDTTLEQQWIEPLEVKPADLYQAQLNRRLKKE